MLLMAEAAISDLVTPRTARVVDHLCLNRMGLQEILLMGHVHAVTGKTYRLAVMASGACGEIPTGDLAVGTAEIDRVR